MLYCTNNKLFSYSLLSLCPKPSFDASPVQEITQYQLNEAKIKGSMFLCAQGGSTCHFGRHIGKPCDSFAVHIRTGNISGTKYVLNDFPFRGPALYCSTAHDSRMTAAFRPGKSVVFLRYSDGGRKDPARKGQAHPRHFLRLHINFHRGHKTKRDALRPFYFRGL